MLILLIYSLLVYCFCLDFSYAQRTLYFYNYYSNINLIVFSLFKCSFSSFIFASFVYFYDFSLSYIIIVPILITFPSRLLVDYSIEDVLVLFEIFLIYLCCLSSIISSLSCLIWAVLLETVTISSIYLSIIYILFWFDFLTFCLLSSESRPANCTPNLYFICVKIF